MKSVNEPDTKFLDYLTDVFVIIFLPLSMSMMYHNVKQVLYNRQGKAYWIISAAKHEALRSSRETMDNDEFKDEVEMKELKA